MVWTELHGAAGDNDGAAIRRLVAGRANVNERDGAGLTALHVAAGEGATDAIKLLCASGAEVNVLSSFEGASPLFMAVNEGRVDCIVALLDAGANVNQQGKDGATVLHEASRNGEETLVKLLLSRNADVHITADGAMTSLHIAVEYHAVPVAALLAAAGADLYADDIDFRAPVTMAHDEAMMTALKSWKPTLIMQALTEFVVKIQERVKKDTAMPIETAEKALANQRFSGLFVSKEFTSFVERMTYKNKAYSAVSKQDLENRSWKVKCYGRYYNCAEIFAYPLSTNQVAQMFVTECIEAAATGAVAIPNLPKADEPSQAGKKPPPSQSKK